MIIALSADNFTIITILDVFDFGSTLIRVKEL